jgi:hypothetical protein
LKLQAIYDFSLSNIDFPKHLWKHKINIIFFYLKFTSFNAKSNTSFFHYNSLGKKIDCMSTWKYISIELRTEWIEYVKSWTQTWKLEWVKKHTTTVNTTNEILINKINMSPMYIHSFSLFFHFPYITYISES